MSARKLWNKVHWLIGLTAGTLLILIGLSGASLSFRDEITALMNTGSCHSMPLAQPVLPPHQLLRAVALAEPGRDVSTVLIYAAPGRAPRVTFAPAQGHRRGETLLVSPYTGAPCPKLKGDAFFEWSEELHRWLLLPRDPGRISTGILASGLLILSLTGLYLRWPRHLNLREWFSVNPSLQGRALLRRIHLVMGTICLPVYILLTLTGIYWSFDAVRDPLSAWLGEPRVKRPALPTNKPVDNLPKARTEAPDLDRAWRSFNEQAGASAWSEVSLRMPSGKAPVIFIWLDAAPPHDKARNRMTVDVGTGEVIQDERYLDKTAGQQFLSTIYPLHTGNYFGTPGRIVMFVAALGLPFFAMTGWMLYLGRRRLARDAARRSKLRVSPG